MGDWFHVITGLLWRQAIVAIPMIITVAALTRWLPCRPATRHLLWATIIAWLCLSPILPQSGLIYYPTETDQAAPTIVGDSLTRSAAVIGLQSAKVGDIDGRSAA